MEVGIHMMMEALGALGLRCVLGICPHTHHRVMAWLSFSAVTSYATVQLVG